MGSRRCYRLVASPSKSKRPWGRKRCTLSRTLTHNLANTGHAWGGMESRRGDETHVVGTCSILASSPKRRSLQRVFLGRMLSPEGFTCRSVICFACKNIQWSAHIVAVRVRRSRVACSLYQCLREARSCSPIHACCESIRSGAYVLLHRQSSSNCKPLEALLSEVVALQNALCSPALQLAGARPQK